MMDNHVQFIDGSKFTKLKYLLLKDVWFFVLCSVPAFCVIDLQHAPSFHYDNFVCS